uniref:Ubiquitin-like domain-containing protein n=1 Tax=Alexandrium catenella TaxID=2925 RepID=A0A7S1WFL4_ALECA
MPLPGISWFHAELKLLPESLGSKNAGSTVLCVQDLSTNHTGLRPPGGSVEQLTKDVLTPVQDGSLFVLPLKVKSTEMDPSKRMCFRIDFERQPHAAFPQPLSARRATSHPQPQAAEEGWTSSRVDVRVLATCNSGGTSLDFKMRPEMKFEKMMQAWCRHHNVTDGEASFRLGNRVLRPEDSPADCGWTPGRGALVVEAMPRPDVAEDSLAHDHDDHSPARAPSCAASFLKFGCGGEEEGSPDLIAYAEDTQAALLARVERERAAKLMRDALQGEAEESDHLSGPSPDSSMME